MPALIPFHEVRFPTAIAFGATGGPERRTEIVALGSGHEERNGRWADSRRRYNAGYGVRSLDDLHAAVAFFEERRGRLYGFRWHDRIDGKSCAPSATPLPTDQAIGEGDGDSGRVPAGQGLWRRARALWPRDPEAGRRQRADRRRRRRADERLEPRHDDRHRDLRGCADARAWRSPPAMNSTFRSASTATGSTST